MAWEQEAAILLELPWDVRMFCPRGATAPSQITEFSTKVSATGKQSFWTKAANWWKLRYEYYCWLRKQESNYDIILLRYYVHDIFQWWFVLKSKKNVFLVHHTLEIPELSSEGPLGKIRAFLEYCIGRSAIRNARGIIGVTGEIVEYQKKRAGKPDHSSYIYPNGILCSEAIIDDNRQEVPELLFVAAHFAPWHGLDLLLKSLGESKRLFRLHLVGDLNPKDEKLAKLDERVIIHGRKNFEEIKNIAAGCRAGLSSFALFRNGMKEACTLKVREYLLMGLPVYADYREMLPQEFGFYYQGPPAVDRIVEQLDIWAKASRQEVAESAKPHINKVDLLHDLYVHLSSVGPTHS